MDNRPIGVFDSGLGGLTAVKELMRIMPNEKILYFGDTGRVPYGSRSKSTIVRYAKQDMHFLMEHNVKAVLAACGTVSSTAKAEGDSLPVPYLDVLRPTARAAVKKTKNKKIGIIGTSATIASGSYRREILMIDPEIEVYEQACPLFVPLVENAFITPQDEVTRLVAERYLGALREKDVDTLILGCTHYPIISATIRGVMGRHVTLVDAGREAAAGCLEALREKDLLCSPEQEAEYQFFVSDDPQQFHQVADLFLGQSVQGQVERIDIYKY